MDERGFLEKGLTCKRCGEELQGEGSGHPVETYAGTYTGLCYKCTGSGTVAFDKDPDSGVVFWEHPPHCPSWRRDRESYMGYPDCEDCKGKGRIIISRSDGMGGNYAVQCQKCSKKHYSHPVIAGRQRENNLEGLAVRIWAHLSDLEYQKRIKAKQKALKVDCLPDAEYAKLREEVFAAMPPRPATRDLAQFPKKWAKPNKYIKELLQAYDKIISEG